MTSILIVVAIFMAIWTPLMIREIRRDNRLRKADAERRAAR